MSELQRALKILRAHTVPKNCNAVSELREALRSENQYWGADWLPQSDRCNARIHHAQQADAHWKAAAEQFEADDDG